MNSAEDGTADFGALSKSASEYQAKLIDAAKANAALSVEYAKAISQVRSASDFFSVTSEFTKKRLDLIESQDLVEGEKKPVAPEKPATNLLATPVVSDVAKDVASDEEKRATATAQEVLAADPATGPIEVRYIDARQDVRDDRFLLLLFAGQKAFLFDRTKGRTIPVPLDDRGATGDERLPALLNSAKSVAADEKLSFVYVVRHKAARDRDELFSRQNFL